MPCCASPVSESGERRAAFAVVDLQRLLHDVVEFYAPLAEDRQQSLELSVNAAAPVPGDRDLLFQAFANLLDNAIKYTPPHGYIKGDLSEQNEQPCVSFADSGPGIPEQERNKALQRFYRLEQSRGTPGNGLGLSLVAAVAKLHDIKLKVEDNAPGLKFVLVFTQSGS